MAESTIDARDTELLDQFCDALWLEDGLSRNTLDGYRRDLTQFQLWLAKRRHVALLDAAHSDLLAYRAYRVAGRVKATTTSRQLSRRSFHSRLAPCSRSRCAEEPAQKPDRRGRRKAARRAQRRRSARAA